MAENKKTFMFIHKFMGIGGIQTYLIRIIKQLKRGGNRIIWIFPEGGYVDDGFKDELMDGSVELTKINLDNFSWINDCNIAFEDGEQVIALAFNLFNFCFLEMIKKKYRDIKIESFFWVPHFKEKGVFIEEFAPKVFWPFLRAFIRKIIIDMESNNNIIYVNKSHLDALTKTYSYEVVGDYKSKLLYGNTREIPPYNNEINIKRSERSNFNIITVGRFSIPHKAYILGIIRIYGKMKKKYDKLRLTIIGYGEDKPKVIQEINKLPLEIKKDINLVGKVPYDRLNEYFESAHINIGVAGTIADGALTGLISIPVRHYTEVCEGYGYLPHSCEYTTSSEPGKPIEGFIEEVINMDKVEYLKLSKLSYDTFAKENKSSGLYNLLSKKNNDSQKTLKNEHIISIRIAFKIVKMFQEIKKKLRGRFKLM